MYKIGIIGFGFVGKALVQGFSLTKDVQIKIYDIKEEVDTFEDTVDNSDIIFLCLPTPMTHVEGGKINLSIMDDVIKKIEKRLVETNQWKDKIIVIRSTVVPGTTRKYAEKYPHMNFVFNPEFLTERMSRLDFINTARIILGGDNGAILNQVKNLYRTRFISTQIFITSWETAEFTKYLCNNFFAQKIMYFNEQKLVALKSENIDWDMAIKMLLADGRIGNSHWEVPGHDGQYGFGGKCFAKDINAYKEWAKSIGAKTPILDAVWEENKEIRQDWDWERIDGVIQKENIT